MSVQVPKKHACPDCGDRHISPNERRENIDRWTNCLHCGQFFAGDYLVLDCVWKAAGLKRRDGVIHLKCLEERLGRHLTMADFKPSPANDAIEHMVTRVSS